MDCVPGQLHIHLKLNIFTIFNPFWREITQTFKGQSSYSALPVQCMWGMSIPCQVLCSIRVDWWLKAHSSVSRKWSLVPCMLNMAMVSRWLTRTWCSLEFENYSDLLRVSWHLKLSANWLFNSLLKLKVKMPKLQWLLSSPQEGSVMPNVFPQGWF